MDGGQEIGHRASHSRAGTEGCSAELMTDPHLLARGQVSGPPALKLPNCTCLFLGLLYLGSALPPSVLQSKASVLEIKVLNGHCVDT